MFSEINLFCNSIFSRLLLMITHFFKKPLTISSSSLPSISDTFENRLQTFSCWCSYILASCSFFFFSSPKFLVHLHWVNELPESSVFLFLLSNNHRIFYQKDASHLVSNNTKLSAIFKSIPVSKRSVSAIINAFSVSSSCMQSFFS